MRLEHLILFRILQLVLLLACAGCLTTGNKIIEYQWNLPSMLKGNSVLASVDAGWRSETDNPLAVRYSGLSPRPKTQKSIVILADKRRDLAFLFTLFALPRKPFLTIIYSRKFSFLFCTSTTYRFLYCEASQKDNIISSQTVSNCCQLRLLVIDLLEKLQKWNLLYH